MAIRDDLKGIGFVLPELVIEAVIRDGLANLVNEPQAIENVFAQLTRPYNSRKYGESELEKIKKLILKKQVNVVHSYSEVPTKVPCYSIQLSNETEDKRLAHLEDFEQDYRQMFDDPQDLANLVLVDNINSTAYNDKTGKVSVADTADLSQVHVNLIFEDADGNEFKILGGVDNTPGQKSFLIDKASTVTLGTGGKIKSSLNFRQFEIKSVTSDVSVIVGVHTKNTLETKYLYTLLKYFMLSRKEDMIRRCFIVSSFQGSDFTRDLRYEGDMVFTRFLTVTGKVEDSWRDDEVELVDNIEVETLVPQDLADAETLDAVHQTVKPSDRDDFDC